MTKLLHDRGLKWEDLPELFRHTAVVTKDMGERVEAGREGRTQRALLSQTDVTVMHNAFAAILMARWDWWKERRRKEHRDSKGQDRQQRDQEGQPSPGGAREGNQKSLIHRLRISRRRLCVRSWTDFVCVH